MKNLIHRWPQSGHSFPKLGHFFQIFEKGLVRPSPSPFCLRACHTRQFHIFDKFRSSIKKWEPVYWACRPRKVYGSSKFSYLFITLRINHFWYVTVTLYVYIWVLKGRNASATALSWFAGDTVHFCVHLKNICGEASTHLYGEEQSF